MISIRDRDQEATERVENAAHALLPLSGHGSALPTDPKHLETMFTFCTTNWRTFLGEKPSGDKLARINAVYKQATLGDYDTAKTESSEECQLEPFQRTVSKMWRSYKGTPHLMAKRRFIALLRDVDIRLLHIKAYRAKPWGFPTTPKGEQICPYSNSKKGCPRPLMDNYGHNLEHELDHNESLQDFVELKKWLGNVAPQQRCAFGRHTPISANMGSRFATFYARPECGGFQAYTPTGLHKMVKKVLTRQLQALVEMQENAINFSKIAQVQQRDRVLGLQMYYANITGTPFTNEIPCSRDSRHCNTKRVAEGRNHTHPVVLGMPPTDFSLYEALIQVRRECTRLGVPPVTGPVHSIDQRRRLLQLKVVDFHRKKMLVYEAQRRQQWRVDVAPRDSAIRKDCSRRHLSVCIRDALVAKDNARTTSLVEAGADSTCEVRGGMYPLMAAVLSRSVPVVRALLAAGADVDRSNSRGMTPLMWAVKRDDYAMVHALIDEGADIGVEGCTGWTAMSIAARHGRMDIAELLVDHLRRDKIAGEMNSDRVLNHRSTLVGGLTPVAIAAIHRDEAMARCLMRLGAKADVKCHRGYTAGDHAMKAGWRMFGLWLQETRAFGANGVYTFADVQAENTLRVSACRMLEAIACGAMVESDTAANERHDTQQLPKPGGEPMQNVASEKNGKRQLNSQPSLFGISEVQLVLVRSSTLLTVKVLQDGHAAPNMESDAGHTALISAAYRGLVSGVRLLIEEGADPNYQNRNDRTAMMAAATKGHVNVIITLLVAGADPRVMDIDGKVAGAYAFEKGFVEVAELLAIAASSGTNAALDWERDRAYRDKEENERERTRKMLMKAGGVESDLPESDMHNWIIRVTKPREAARLAELRQAATRENRRTNSSPGATEETSRPPNLPMSDQAKEGRCPKCTLVVPCLHYVSIEILEASFPEGVPEWRWSSRQPDQRGKLRSSVAEKNAGGSSGLLENRDSSRTISWWRSLEKRCRRQNVQHSVGSA